MFEIILKAIMTAAILFLTVNTFFKFQVSIDRVLLFTIGLFLIVCFAYYDTLKVHEFHLTVGIVIVIGVILKIVALKYRNNGYILLNVYRKNYLEVKNKITELSAKYNIIVKDINYNVCKPWVIVFKNSNRKDVKKLLKEFDKSYSKSYKKVTMYNYWYVVVILILIAALWRF